MRIRAWGALPTERSHACTSGPIASRSPRSPRMSTAPLASSDRNRPQLHVSAVPRDKFDW